jgi:hypothetical protein
LLCAFTLAGCAGQVDLSKSVSNRTTVKAGGSFGDDMLRQIEPCGLFSKETIASIGQADPNKSADRSGYSDCNLQIKDSTGKSVINLLVKVGDSLFAAPKQTGKQINGLSVSELQTSTGCTETAVTGRDPDRGITVQVVWDGGDPCKVGGKLIEAVIKTMATNPPKYENTPGSLVNHDSCADMDDKAVKDLLGADAQKSPYGIRACTFTSKDASLSLYVTYAIDFEPFANNSSDHPAKVDLTDKVKGAAQWKDTISPNKCQIEWVQRALAGNRGENVNVSFERVPPDPKEDPCAKVLPAAKALAGKLSP